MTTTSAPRITRTMLRRATTSCRGVVVRYLDADVVAPLPEGLTEVLADDPDVDVLLTPAAITYWLQRAGEDHDTAVRLINRDLADQHRAELAAEARLEALAVAA